MKNRNFLVKSHTIVSFKEQIIYEHIQTFEEDVRSKEG